MMSYFIICVYPHRLAVYSRYFLEFWGKKNPQGNHSGEIQTQDLSVSRTDVASNEKVVGSNANSVVFLGILFHRTLESTECTSTVHIRGMGKNKLYSLSQCKTTIYQIVTVPAANI